MSSDGSDDGDEGSSPAEDADVAAAAAEHLRAQMTPALVESLSEQLRGQHSDLAKSFAQAAVGPALKGLSEQLRGQHSDLAKSFAQAAVGPALKGLRRYDAEQLEKIFMTLSAEPELHRVRGENQQIAATIGRMRVDVAVDDELEAGEGEARRPMPDSLYGELAEAAALLASVSETLPVRADEGSDVEAAGSGAAEVFAILAALIWLSALAGLWLQEASRTSAPQIAELSRWQLMSDLYLLVSTTQAVHDRVRVFLRPADGRVFFRDVKPYAIVDDLDQLRGPAAGVVELSHSVLWAPGGGLVDLSLPGELRMAYRAVLNEGAVQDLVDVLNRDRLVVVWPELMLPRRVREMWESRFPELRSDEHTITGA